MSSTLGYLRNIPYQVRLGKGSKQTWLQGCTSGYAFKIIYSLDPRIKIKDSSMVTQNANEMDDSISFLER